MTCKRCGVCCRTDVFEVDDEQREIHERNVNHKKTIIWHDRTYVILRRKCKHQAGNLCRDYANRPNACRNFPANWPPTFPPLNMILPECGYNKGDADGD